MCLFIPSFWIKLSERFYILYLFSSAKTFQLHSKSYFRLQQTCRYTKEFIERGNIIVHLDGIYFLQRDSWETPWAFQQFQPYTLLGVEGLRAARLRELHSPPSYGRYPLGKEDFDEAFEQLCDILRKNKISCQNATIHMEQASTEQCVTLLNILKPEKFFLNSQRSQRFEAFLHSKRLVSLVGLVQLILLLFLEKGRYSFGRRRCNYGSHHVFSRISESQNSCDISEVNAAIGITLYNFAGKTNLNRKAFNPTTIFFSFSALSIFQISANSPSLHYGDLTNGLLNKNLNIIYMTTIGRQKVKVMKSRFRFCSIFHHVFPKEHLVRFLSLNQVILAWIYVTPAAQSKVT